MKRSITDYIPQRPPMVMIDTLIHADGATATTVLNILPQNIFSDQGHFTEPGMIENIAQTAAAMVGHQSKLNNTPVPVGFIAAVKNWKLVRTAKINSAIETTIRVINSVGDISIVEGKISQGNRELCTCEMRILVQRGLK